MNRWMEFFEGDTGRLSMTRLLCFLSWPPASIALIMDSSEGMLGWYLGAYVLGYVGGKASDIFMKPSAPTTTERTMTEKTTITQPEGSNV